jgi:hypothetical protein
MFHSKFVYVIFTRMQCLILKNVSFISECNGELQKHNLVLCLSLKHDPYALWYIYAAFFLLLVCTCIPCRKQLLRIYKLLLQRRK